MVREITMFREEHNEKVDLVVAEGNNIVWLEKSRRQMLALDGQSDWADVTDVCRETRNFLFLGGLQDSRRYERRTEKGGRLSHVYLPLYPYILKGISLTVSVGGSRYLIFNSAAAEVFAIQSRELWTLKGSPDFTCSRRRAPLLAEWLVWQRFQCGGLHSPWPLWGHALRPSIKSANQGKTA